MGSGDPFDEMEQEAEFEVDLQRPEGADPKGDYIAICTDVQSSVSKQGNPMWVWKFQLIADTKGDRRHAGVEMPYHTALVSQALWKAEETLVALGLAKPGEKARFAKRDAIGRLCQVQVVENEYQGRKRPQIQAVGPHPKGAGYREPVSGLPGAATPGDDAGIPF